MFHLGEGCFFLRIHANSIVPSTDNFLFSL